MGRGGGNDERAPFTMSSRDASRETRAAKMSTEPPSPTTLLDVEEFMEQQRQAKQASNMQMVMNAGIIIGLIVTWFQGRNKPRKKKGNDGDNGNNDNQNNDAGIGGGNDDAGTVENA